jgi:hypothetical protein
MTRTADCVDRQRRHLQRSPLLVAFQQAQFEERAFTSHTTSAPADFAFELAICFACWCFGSNVVSFTSGLYVASQEA